MKKKNFKTYQKPLGELLSLDPSNSILEGSPTDAPENFDGTDNDINELFQ